MNETKKRTEPDQELVAINRIQKILNGLANAEAQGRIVAYLTHRWAHKLRIPDLFEGAKPIVRGA